MLWRHFSAEEPWVLEIIRIPSDACGRANSIWIRYVWTWKLLNPERKSCGFKNIRIRVAGASVEMGSFLLPSCEGLIRVKIQWWYCLCQIVLFYITIFCLMKWDQPHRMSWQRSHSPLDRRYNTLYFSYVWSLTLHSAPSWYSIRG